MITFAQWENELLDLAFNIKEIADRQLRIEIVNKNELWLQTDNCRGMISLRPIPDKPLEAQPHICVSSGTALAGMLDYVENGLRDYEIVVKALRYAEDQLADLTVGEEATR